MFLKAPQAPPPPAWMRRGLFVYCRQTSGKGAAIQTIKERLDQLEKRNRRLTVGWIAMMVAIAIQFSACGDDPAGPSTNCDISAPGAVDLLHPPTELPLAGRNLSECNLANAYLKGARLNGANLENAKLESATWRMRT